MFETLTVTEFESIEDEFGEVFKQAYKNLNTGGGGKDEIDDDEFFNQNFLYDQNYHRNSTVLQNGLSDQRGRVARGMYLDFNISREHSSNGSFETRSRLSRMVKSDIIRDTDCFEGYLEKKSPKLLVGWQVSENT